MSRNRIYRSGLGWVEILLILAVISCLLQVFPSLWDAVSAVIDIRQWPRAVWFYLNAILIVIFVCARFAPDFYNAWSNRQMQLAIDRKKKHELHARKAERERLEQIRQARSRRIY